MHVLRPVARVLAPCALALSLLAGTAGSAHAAGGFTVRQNFVNPGATVSGVSLTVHTWFEGNGPVTLTVGTGPNVKATAVTAVTTSTHFASSWTLTISKLWPHKAYYYSLAAPDARTTGTPTSS